MSKSIGAFACPRNRKGCLSALALRREQEAQRKGLPFFEVLAMGVIFYATNHEISQVAVFMCYHIDKTVLKFVSSFL